MSDNFNLLVDISDLPGLYGSGEIIGAFIDDPVCPSNIRQIAIEEKDEVLANVDFPLLTANADLTAIAGSSRDKLCTIWHYYLKTDPKKGMKGAQLTGDCVSWGVRTASDITRNWEIWNKSDEQYVERQATALIYSGRGFTGQGASPARLSDWHVKTGYLLEQVIKDTIGKEWDFTEYQKYVKLGMSYGRSGLPSSIIDITKQHRLLQTSLVEDLNALADCLWNGYGAHCGSSIGVTKTGSPVSRVSGSWAHDMCYSSDTDILTQRGFIPITDLIRNDLVATLDPKTHELCWEYPSAIHKLPFNGDLWHFERRGLDFLVTPNHRMYGIRQCKTHANGEILPLRIEDFEFIRADEVANSFKVKYTSEWHGAEVLVHELPCGTKVSMDLWLEFLGYYLSEGSTYYCEKARVRASGNTCIAKVRRTSISQSKQDNVKIMWKCLRQLPFNFRRYERGSRWDCNSKELWMELANLGKQLIRRIPDYVWECSSRQLQILFEAMCLGDGSLGVNGNWSYYHTSSELMADDFQRLLLQVGLSGKLVQSHEVGDCEIVGKITHRQKGYYVTIRNEFELGSLGRAHTIKYEGDTYCPTTKNGIVFVRRNGKAAWCGNSIVGFDDRPSTKEKFGSRLWFWDQSWGEWNSVTNLLPEWLPWGQGMFILNENDTWKAVRAGGTWVFSNSDGFPARPFDNLLI